VDPLKLKVAMAEFMLDCDPSKPRDAAPDVQSAEEYPVGAVNPVVVVIFEVPFVVVTTTRIVPVKPETDGVVPEALNNRYSALFADKLAGMVPDAAAFAMSLAERIGIIDSAKTKKTPKNLLRISNLFPRPGSSCSNHLAH
jgi:hypothetical protein